MYRVYIKIEYVSVFEHLDKFDNIIFIYNMIYDKYMNKSIKVSKEWYMNIYPKLYYYKLISQFLKLKQKLNNHNFIFSVYLYDRYTFAAASSL